MSDGTPREHSWQNTTVEGRYYEERYCPVCEMRDMKMAADGGSTPTWIITQPCIEPVPKTISYEDLLKDLKAHGIEQEVLFMGVPGRWSAGFAGIGPRNQPMSPCVGGHEDCEIEEACAKLLRWVRFFDYEITNIEFHETQPS